MYGEKGFGLYDPDNQLKIPEEYLISDNGNEVFPQEHKICGEVTDNFRRYLAGEKTGYD